MKLRLAVLQHKIKLKREDKGWGVLVQLYFPSVPTSFLDIYLGLGLRDKTEKTEAMSEVVISTVLVATSSSWAMYLKR